MVLPLSILFIFSLFISRSLQQQCHNIRDAVDRINAVHKSGVGRENITIDPDAIDKYIQDIIDCRDSVSSVSIAIVQLDDDDEVVGQYNSAYGPLDPVRPDDGDADNHTRFCLGSITKQFTAATVGLALEHEGKAYDTQLIDLLGEEGRFYDKENLDRLPTVRDLLAHRMGIPRYDTALLVGLDGTRLPYWEHLHELADRDDEYIAEKYRSSFEYNNWMVTLAGYVYERLSNKTWEAGIWEHYFLPLDLHNATFLDLYYAGFADPKDPEKMIYPNRTYENFAIPAIRIGNKSDPSNYSWVPIDKFYFKHSISKASPAGGICMSSEDMLKYLTFLVNDTKEEKGHEEEKRLKKKIKETMYDVSQYVQPSGISMPEGPLYSIDTYALCWARGFYRGYELVGHSGSVDGWLSYEAIFPKLKLGIIVSTTNGMYDTDSSDLIALGLFDLIMGKNDPLSTEKICKVPVSYPSPDPETLKPFDDCFDTHNFMSLEPLDGVYQHKVFGNVTIRYNRTANNTERFRFDYGHYGRGILCPSYLDPDNQFRLYFDRDTPLWPANDLDISLHLGMELIFHRDHAHRATHFVFPGLEKTSPTTELQSYYKHDYRPCDPNPCQNGGTCTKYGDQNFVCQCPPPVSGTVCDMVTLKDCSDWLKYHPEESKYDGVYQVDIPGIDEPYNVYCDMTTDGGGWTVIHRRVDDVLDFNQTKDNYTIGFGEPGKLHNLWLGLDALHQLAPDNASSYELLVELEDCDNMNVSERYTGFWIGEKSKYTLHLNPNSAKGKAGDALTVSNSFLNHNNMPFSTVDDDNDDGCASQYHSGWWFNDCFAANLNGVYYKDCDTKNHVDGIVWLPFRNAKYSMKRASMKIRRS